jgi:hypothetical protein
MREINDMRLKLEEFDPIFKSERLTKYIDIFKKCSLFDDYPLKLEDVTNIVKLALELKEFAIVHEYCNKIYEDDVIDKLSFYKFQGQAYEAQKDFRSAFYIYFKTLEICDNDEILNSLQRVLKEIEGQFKKADKVFYELCVKGENVINADGQMNDFVSARIMLNKKSKEKPSLEKSSDKQKSYESFSLTSQPLQRIMNFDKMQSTNQNYDPRSLFVRQNAEINSLALSSTNLSTNQAHRASSLPQTIASDLQTAKSSISSPRVLSSDFALSTDQKESVAPAFDGDFVFSEFPAQANQQIPNHRQAFDEYGGVGFRRALLALQTSNEFTTPSSSSIASESVAPAVEADFIFPDFPAQPNQQIPNHHQAFDESGGVGLNKALLESIVSETVKNQLAGKKREDDVLDMESVKKMIKECEERLKTANTQDRRKIEEDLISLRFKYSNLEQRQIKAEARQDAMKVAQDDMMIRQDRLELEQDKMKIRIKIIEDRIGRIGRIMGIDEIIKIFKSQIQQSKEDNPTSSSDLIQIHDQLATRNKDRDQFYQDKIDEIKKNELYSNYYCSLVSELNSLYLVSMTVKNDLIKTVESEKYQKIVAYSKVMYNFIPVVGPLVEGVVDVIAITRDKCKDIFSKEKMQRFAQLAEGVNEFEQISLRLAINLMDYQEIRDRANQAKCLLDGASLRDAVFSRVDEQVTLLQNEDDEEIFKCQNNCFELAKNIYFNKSEKIGTVLGRLDAVKIIELIQEKGFVESIIEESQVKKSNGDIRRTKSIIAESIIEEFNKKKNLKSQANANEYQDGDSEKSFSPNSTISNQEKVNCLTGLKKSIMKCAGY